MVKVIWTEQAIDDLTNIAQYSSGYSEKYASTIVSKLFNKTNILKTMPRIGRMVPERNSETIRELIEGNYRIIYEISSEDKIDVLTVHHSSKPLGDIK
ncbi:type II toxin-antitoxin system RelE/ParE family toxin [Rhodocytophaga aerolata]|uniref:type II toxin-antitoxin system RelE/ParE family toxin n=1 Tax=Rhodocytophaga aerolata TaxID=455078 RepID=UPI003459B876